MAPPARLTEALAVGVGGIKCPDSEVMEWTLRKDEVSRLVTADIRGDATCP